MVKAFCRKRKEEKILPGKGNAIIGLASPSLMRAVM
jgi:hypothetical protein